VRLVLRVRILLFLGRLVLLVRLVRPVLLAGTARTAAAYKPSPASTTAPGRSPTQTAQQATHPARAEQSPPHRTDQSNHDLHFLREQGVRLRWLHQAAHHEPDAPERAPRRGGQADDPAGVQDDVRLAAGLHPDVEGAR